MPLAPRTISLHLAAMSLCLLAIWSSSFLPMQDYPLHLFLANTLATFGDQQYNWSDHYLLNPQFTPYSLLYHVLAFVGHYTGISVAGKAIVSIYVLLMAYISLRSSEDTSTRKVIWPGLLLLPLIFNQVYYLGFVNYLISMPLLVIALQQHRAISHYSPPKSYHITHLLTLLLLFLVHPYALAVFIASSMILQLKHTILKTQNHRFSPIPIVSLILMATWLLSNSSPNNLHYGLQNSAAWLSPSNTLLFFLMSLTNSAPASPTIIIPITLWMSIFFTITPSIKKHSSRLIKSDFFLLFIATAIGLFILPFALGEYHYFSLRLAPVSLIFLILSFRVLEFSRQQKVTLTLCSLLLILHGIYTHAMISQEKEDILPVLAVMKPNASLLPLYLNGSSEHLNRYVYYQFSEHDHNYYHLYVGGGVSPNILPNQMFPVLNRTAMGANTPALARYDYWLQQAPKYDYLLIRHGEDKPTPALPPQFDPLFRNRSWELLINSNSQL